MHVALSGLPFLCKTHRPTEIDTRRLSFLIIHLDMPIFCETWSKNGDDSNWSLEEPRPLAGKRSSRHVILPFTAGRGLVVVVASAAALPSSHFRRFSSPPDE